MSHSAAAARGVAWLVVLSLTGTALADGPVVRPSEPITVSPDSEWKFAPAVASDAGPLRFELEAVSRQGQPINGGLPGLTLAADTGQLTWTPKRAQVGEYTLTLAVRDKNDAVARLTLAVTVKPRDVLTGKDALATKLNGWFAAGSAAGNVGEFYDNRDRDHSAINRSRFTQLDETLYTEQDRKTRRDWAAFGGQRSPVTFGNSSTSAGVGSGGCNVRSLTVHPAGAAALYKQYRGNNLYVYPAHHDYQHSPYGRPFFGDVLLANTPYLLSSRGSSGSDQVFLSAVITTSAAFHPTVKQKLVANGMLMPTIQMLLRSSLRGLKRPEDYLTGRAHPAAFDGGKIDIDKMVEAAHAMTVEQIPPLALIRVTKEDTVRPGVDYFDPLAGEKLFDTPAAVCRIFRGSARTRTYVVTAEDSTDVNGKPLTFAWRLLRGDPERVKIEPAADGRTATVTIAHHPRYKCDDMPEVLTGRVDIGVFAHNGANWSPPAILSVAFLSNESRTYTVGGRLLEIGHGPGVSFFEVGDWEKFFAGVTANSPTAEFLRGRLTEADQRVLTQAGFEVLAAATAVRTAREKKEKTDGLSRALEAALDRQHTGRSARQVVTGLLDELITDLVRLPLGEAGRKLIAELGDDPVVKRMEAAFARPKALGLIAEKDGRLVWQPIELTPAPEEDRLSEYERQLAERLIGEWLSPLLEPLGVRYRLVPGLADLRLATSRDWRDLYQHDADGSVIGWTRLRPDGSREDFTADGAVVLTRDELGRAKTARTVIYKVTGNFDFNRGPMPLAQTPGGEVLTYEYASDSDRRGRVAARSTTTPLPEKK